MREAVHHLRASAARGDFATPGGYGVAELEEARHGGLPQVRLGVQAVHGRGPVPLRVGEARGIGQVTASLCCLSEVLLLTRGACAGGGTDESEGTGKPPLPP